MSLPAPPEQDDRLPAETERKLFKLFISWLTVTTVILGTIAGGAAYLLNASIIEAGKTSYQQLAYQEASKEFDRVAQREQELSQRINVIDSQLTSVLDKNYTSVADMRSNVGLSTQFLSEIKHDSDETKKLLSGLQQAISENEKLVNSLSDEKSITEAVSKDSFKDAIAPKVAAILQQNFTERENSIIDRINKQFSRLNTESANGYTFANTSSPTGAGYNPEVPPGRCPVGSYVAGIQPLPIGAGGGGIRFLCAVLPSLAIGNGP